VPASTYRLPAVALAGLIALGPAPALCAGRLDVLVSVQPLQWLVDRIGAERVSAQTLVPPGSSPATYNPSPREMTALAGARLYVRVGVPFERAWMPRITAANPDMAVLDLREAVELRAMEPGHGHARGESAHQPSALDPHVWTSPPNLIAMAGLVRDRLTALDAAGGPVYAANYDRLADDLRRLDLEIRAALAGRHQRRFVVFHPSWGYFADAYDLEQLPVEREGKSPGPRTLGRLIEEARQAGIRVVFVQPQFSPRAARTLADALGARVIEVDPLAYDIPHSLLRLARYIGGGEP
jgi:zinc transport system substrate-binding protein